MPAIPPMTFTSRFPSFSMAELAPFLVALLCAATSFFRALNGPDRDPALTIWAWGAIAMWCVICDHRGDTDPTRHHVLNRPLAWSLLLAAWLCHFFRQQDIGVFLVVLAVIDFSAGMKRMVAAALPLFLWLIVLPSLPYFQFLVSYPLRLISTEATVTILQWCGMPVGGSGTVIVFGEQKVAITAACSGIEQLEAMLLVGWIIVTVLYRTMRVRLMHFAMILPLILLVNALRLIVTLLLYHQWGEAAFSDTIHTTLGITMVITVSLLFLSLKGLFAESPSVEKNQSEGTSQ